MEHPDSAPPPAGSQPPPFEPLESTAPSTPPNRDAAAPAAGGTRRTRDLATAAIALAIGLASILSAVVAWRASLATIDASRLQSLAVQQQARREELTRELEAVVAQDQRLVVVFQEHALAARELQQQADEVRDSDPDAADQLDLQAHGRRAQARAIEPFFQGWGGIHLDEEGTAVYDPDFVLRNLLDGDTELRELRPQETMALAQRFDVRTVSLIAVAAVLVAALFCLTVAQAVRRRPLLRHAFALVGGVLVVAGAIGLVVIEVTA